MRRAEAPIEIHHVIGAGQRRAAERLRFVKVYLGVQRLDANGKHFVRDVLAFKHRKWPGYRL